MAKESIPWFKQYMLSPLVVGLAVLVGQFFLQPHIAQKQESRVERLREKRRVFARAMQLIGEEIESSPLVPGPGAAPLSSRLSEPPSPDQINAVYGELLLVVNDPGTFRAFLACLRGKHNTDFIPLGRRITFADRCRQELGYEPIDLEDRDVVFWQRAAPQDSNTPAQ